MTGPAVVIEAPAVANTSEELSLNGVTFAVQDEDPFARMVRQGQEAQRAKANIPQAEFQSTATDTFSADAMARKIYTLTAGKTRGGADLENNQLLLMKSLLDIPLDRVDEVDSAWRKVAATHGDANSSFLKSIRERLPGTKGEIASGLVGLGSTEDYSGLTAYQQRLRARCELIAKSPSYWERAEDGIMAGFQNMEKDEAKDLHKTFKVETKRELLSFLTGYTQEESLQLAMKAAKLYTWSNIASIWDSRLGDEKFILAVLDGFGPEQAEKLNQAYLNLTADRKYDSIEDGIRQRMWFKERDLALFSIGRLMEEDVVVAFKEAFLRCPYNTPTDEERIYQLAQLCNKMGPEFTEKVYEMYGGKSQLYNDIKSEFSGKEMDKLANETGWVVR